MSRNLLTDCCPDCERPLPDAAGLVGRPLEFRSYMGDEPAVPGARYDCPCGLVLFVWLARPAYGQDGAIDASYYESFNDEPGSGAATVENPAHLVVGRLRVRSTEGREAYTRGFASAIDYIEKQGLDAARSLLDGFTQANAAARKDGG